VLLELDADRPGGFQKLFFDRQILPLRGVGNEMDRRAEGSDRGDREMTLAMLAAAAERRRLEMASLGEENRTETLVIVREALGLGSDAEAPDIEGGRAAQLGRTPATAEFTVADPVMTRLTTVTANSQARRRNAEQAMHRYQVEYHKKWTLAVACIVFVLVGIPLAIRFPRGGLGLVIAASSAIFAVYWVGLIAGEDVADRGIAPPWMTMWVPNVLFLTLGLILVKRMGREAATMRGGGWDELWWTLATPLRRLRRRRLGEPAGDAA
jgi:lipopolysaccharide export system permease protein